MKDTIEGLRVAIAQAKAELAQIKSAGPSRAEQRARNIAFAQAAAAEGEQRMKYGVLSDTLAYGFTLHSGVTGGNLAPMLGAVLGVDALAAALNKHLDELPEGLDAAARIERISAIAAELDSLETLEEQMIVRSEQAGSPIARRGDARPEIVLAMTDAAPAPLDAPQVKAKGVPRLVPMGTMSTEPPPPRPTVARSQYMKRGD